MNTAPLRLVREGPATKSPTRIMRNSADVATFMAPYAERELVEVFWVLLLDARRRVIDGAPVEISRGILNASLVHAREVFRAAIVGGARSLIAVHNHPSGDPSPSADDNDITRALSRVGRFHDIPLEDHLILGIDEHYSYAASGSWCLAD